MKRLFLYLPLLLAAPQVSAEEWTIPTAEENAIMCANTAPYATSPPFPVTREGIKNEFSRDVWGNTNALEVVEIEWIGKSFNPSTGYCLSNRFSSMAYGRLTDPRGSRICKLLLEWEGPHVYETSYQKPSKFREGKGMSYEIIPNSCRWE